MKTVSASLNIELNVTCPYCDEFMDLMQDDYLNEEGQMTKEAAPEGDWNESHDAFETEVTCQECGKDFMAKTIVW